MKIKKITEILKIFYGLNTRMHMTEDRLFEF